MLDTIVLLLDEEKFQIDEPDKFIPSARWASEENRKYNWGMRSKQNPTKRELRNGVYKPRLTLFSRFNTLGMHKTSLKIEVSLPKLFFGNNFAELQYKDRFPVTEKLVDVLKQMGVITTLDIILNAHVSAIHYSKNIPLTDGSTPYHFINKIKEANIQLSLDVNQTDYRNDGYSYRWHCNSYEVVFYDKIKDLQRGIASDKKALEKDSEIQLELFKKLKKRRRKFEVLRMEVRLNKRQKIKQLFKKLDIKVNLIFKKLFKPAVAKKVLLYYLDEMDSKRPIILDYKLSSYKDFLTDLIFDNPELKPKQVAQIYGLKCMLDVVNLRELQVMFSRHSMRSWQRFMADVKKIKLSTINQPFKIIRNCLVKFKPLRFKKVGATKKPLL